MQRILLVEDNEMNRDLISRRLKRRGYEVVCAEDGAKGVEAASKVQPSLILMDIGLPVIDGYEATRLIKSNAATRSVPVIGLSAHAMSGDAEKAMQAGCDDYDTKPIDWPRLLGKIQSLLEKASQEAASQADDPAPGTATEQTESSGRILLVDDTPLHLEMLSGRLSQLGFAFKAVRSADEALAALGDETFDLILVDVGMQIGGDKLWRRLAAHPSRGDSGLLLLSPIDLIADAVAGLGDGVDEVLVQPFRIGEVKHRLRQALRLHRLESRYGTLRDSVEKERRRAEYLMASRLPAPLLDELRSRRRLPPRVEETVVLSMDMPGLLRRLRESDPKEVLASFQHWVTTFEASAEARNVQLLAVQGASVTAAAGPFSGAADPVRAVVESAWETMGRAGDLGPGLAFRCGVHVGAAVVGVIGRRNFFLGAWGDVPDIAVSVRDAGIPGTLHVSEDVWGHLQGVAEGEVVGSVPTSGQELQIYRIKHLT